MSDFVCLLLLTPLTVVSAFMCSSGAVFYIKHNKIAEAAGLVGLASVLGIVFLLWLLLTIRYHCQVWFKWRSSHQEIRLLELESTSNKTESQESKIAILPTGEMSDQASCSILETGQMCPSSCVSDTRDTSHTVIDTKDTNHMNIEDNLRFTSNSETKQIFVTPSPVYNPTMEDVQVCKTPRLKLEEDTPRTVNSCDVRQDTRVRPTLAIPRLYNEIPISQVLLSDKTNCRTH